MIMINKEVINKRLTIEELVFNNSTNPIGIIDPNGYEKINRVYTWCGFAPCVTGRDYKDPIKVLVYG